MKKSLIFTFAILILTGCTVPIKKIVQVDTCYKGIKLGDNLTCIKSKLVGLQVNHEGEHNEYFTISESQIKMDEGHLNPSVFLKFNENDELVYFSISFTYEGVEKNDQLGWKIFNQLIEQEILCLKGETLNGKSYLKHATRKTRFEEEGFPSFKFEIKSK